jgi:VCBS repeat-containing protein
VLAGLEVELAPGAHLFLRWSGDDVAGSGGRDQYGIDNVSIEFLTVNDGLTVSSVTQGANGSVSANADGTVTYVPSLNFHGIDSFTYTVSDGELTDTASVTVTVTPVNDAPVGVDDSASTAEDTPVSIPVLANDTDVDPVAHTVFLADFDDFLGTGFAPEPAAGQLDSDLWSAGGFSDAADLARGSSPTPVVTGGIYAFTDVGTAGNTILGVQPSADDFTPGFIELRLANSSDAVVAFVDLSYEIWAYNDQDRASSLRFSYSLDGISFVSVAALDFVSSEARDTAVAWQQSLRSLAGLAVDLDPGEAIILRWSGDDASGSGVRDQYGIDTVRVGFASVNEGLAVTAVTHGTNGSVSINADGSVTYAPNLNFHGTDSFTYTVSDGELADTANVTVTVTPVNDAPVGVDDSASTAEDTPVSIPVLANDSDVDPQARTVFVAGFDDFLGAGFAPEPAAGQLDSDFWHAGGFSDAADLARGASSMPVVTGGIYAFTDVGTAGNTILGLQPAADDFTPGFIDLRLVNDTDAVIATIGLSYEIWTYNDAARANSLNFSYSLDGIAFSSVAALDFASIEAADAAPDWQQTLRSLAALAVNLEPGEEIILRWSGDDVSGSGGRDQYGIDNVTVGFAAANEGLEVAAVTQGSNGSVIANADGTVTYMPNANFHGTDSFTYTVRDGAGALDTANVTVTVTPVNDAPVAAGDSFATDEDTPLVVAAPGVLGNDTDVDLESLTAALVTGPAQGTLTLNADGSFTYTPDAGFSGSDAFTYKAVDGAGGESAVATVSLTVRPANDAPEVDGGEDQLVGLQKKSLGYATITLEGLFTDADLADTHVATIDWGDGSQATDGLVDQAAGSITGTHSYEEVGVYTVTVTVRDNSGAERSDTLLITVVDPAKSQVIRARSDRYQVAEGGSLQVAAPEGVLSNDSGIAGATLQARLVAGPQHGTLTFNSDGSFSYTADAGFTGRDFFWYEINDGTNVSKAVKVWLVVAPVEVAHLDWTACVAAGKPKAAFLGQITWTQSLADWLARLTSADT